MYNDFFLFKKYFFTLIESNLYKSNLLELILIDSGSFNEVSKDIKKTVFKFKNTVYLKSQNRESLYKAWNRGIRIANGKYISNANTDDRHAEHCLESLVNHLEKNLSIDLAYGILFKSTNPNETYEDNDKSVSCTSQKFFPGSLLLHDYTGAQPVWRKSIHDKIGLFDENYEVVGDYEFVLRAISNGCKFSYVPEAQGLMLWHNNALSTKDSRGYSEKQKLFDQYRTSENITRIYKDSCSDSQNVEEEAHLDLGIRALCFYPQFNSGNPSFDFEFAKKCFSYSETNPAFLHNLTTLNQLLCAENLVSGNGENQLSDFFFYGSAEEFPPEYLLKGTLPAYLQVNGFKELEGRKYQTFTFSVKKFHDFFFGHLPLNDLSRFESVYICGFNQRGKLLRNWLSKKISSELIYLDSNAKSLTSSKIEVLTFENGIRSHEKAAFILAMSSHHWDAVESLILKSCPAAFIFKIDHS